MFWREDDAMVDFSVASRVYNRARDALETTGEDQIVYSRDGKLTTVSFKTYKLLDLDTKGARRICLIVPPLFTNTIM
jgi:hypothetical protein